MEFIDFHLIYKTSAVSMLCAGPPGLPLVFALQDSRKATRFFKRERKEEEEQW